MEVFDVFGKVVDWTLKTKEAFDLAASVKHDFQEATQQAQMRRFREAVKIAEKILAPWAGKIYLSQQWVKQVFLGDFLEQVKVTLCEWRQVINEADTLVHHAESLLETDTANPLQTQVLIEVLALFQKSNSLMCDRYFIQSVSKCELEILKRQKFQALVGIAEEYTQSLRFQAAVKKYLEAQELYQTVTVQRALEFLDSQVKREEAYEAILKKVTVASVQGRLGNASALLKSAVTDFPRSDGLELLKQLQRTIKGKKQFLLGLTAEKAGNFQEAASLYKVAQAILPDPTECKIRLGLVALKTQDWAIALSHLENICGEQAAYLRGFTYAQQGNLQQAYLEWQSVSHPDIELNRLILKTMSQQQRLRLLQNIEQCVQSGNFEASQAASLQFLQKFGSDKLVEDNLKEHIQPRLDAAIWQNTDWEIIVTRVEEIWISQPDLITLHNWAVATYYHALETHSVVSIQNFIIALSTALANLADDPAWQKIPWLGTQPVDLESICLGLKRRIEEVIERCKDRDPNEYLQLRDIQRLEYLSLHLMKTQPNQDIKINNIRLPPSCYNKYFHQWQENLVDVMEQNQSLLRSLYTPWGLAVAACLEGDTHRAIQLKPIVKPQTSIEFFAEPLVAYHEGCYQLVQQKWREAMIPLKKASTEIKVSVVWQQEIDRLCSTQRQKISKFKEHLEFAQFWYNLLGSQSARSYFAEYKAEQIWIKLANQQISSFNALEELQNIKQIDEFNPVVLDFIGKVRLFQEIEIMEQLLKNNKFEEAISLAKKSNHQRVKFKVAEFFVQILSDSVGRKLGDLQMIHKLGRFAYEVCPDESAFQEIYRSLKLR
ncbi:MAG: peptidase M, neutral zinc metallopeptidase site [Rhizonema sp. PD37]|nr:peptidase M, neutral zinc metallopeptidase site [Rhizonema sp. PD37]